jgi:hypothetical protein
MSDVSRQEQDLHYELQHGGKTWTTDEMQEEFVVLGFSAPFVIVERKSDRATGTLEFTHFPRYYFDFTEAS